MKKILIGLVVIIAIVAIATTVFVGKMDGIIADAIETEGTATLGSKVRVASVKTNLREGTATIKGLTVANAPGYSAANAMSIATFTADVDYETQTVKRIVINNPVINAEVKGQKNNFEDLLANMPDDEEVVGEEEEETEITIDRFELRQTKVNLVADKLGTREFMMSDLVLTNLSGTVDQITERLTTELTSHVANEVKAYATREIGKMLKEEATRRIKEEVNEKIKDKLGGKLKGLKFGIN